MFDFLNDPNILPAIGVGSGFGATFGSIATAVVNKFLNRKQDGTTIAANQVAMLNDVNENLNEVVKQLQDIACYREPCKIRINANYVRKKSTKKEE